MNKLDQNVFVDLVCEMGSFIDSSVCIKSATLAYHYTPFKSALNIINSFDWNVGGSELFNTRHDYLSDDYEGKDVEDCYHEAIKKYLASHALKPQIVNLLYGLKVDDTYYVFEYKSPDRYTPYITKAIAYICCFSLKGDSKYMWDHYLKGEKSGFALGYSVVDLQSNAKSHLGKQYKHIIQKVFYKKEDKIQYIYDFLGALLSKTDKETYIKFYVKNFLNCNKYVFKKDNFSEEQELRSVIFYPLDEKSNLKTINYGKTIPFKFNILTRITDVVYYHNGNDRYERFLLSQTSNANKIRESKYSKE